MAQTVLHRWKNAWNAFFNKDPTGFKVPEGSSYSVRPDRVRLTRGNERTIITAIYNRIALDVASLKFQHIQLDNNGRFKDTVKTNFNECLTLSANIDQISRAFHQDAILSMLDEGVVAIVPVDTDIDPHDTESFDVLSMRTGKIVDWKPRHVKINVYNDQTGEREDIWMPKEKVAIIENPFYAVMNEPNSTLKRLVRKLTLLDFVDEQTSSGKLDLIVQLPYTIKTPVKQKQAEERRKDIEMQLTGSRYGIAYIDSTEKVTQLNRPVENNLLKQIDNLTSMLYSQLGISVSILDGTADERTLLNYNNRIVNVIASVYVDELKRKFLSKTARTQGKSVDYFTDPFKNISVGQMADIVDKFTRNEFATTNEMRQGMGMKPSSDPEADKLKNPNMPQEKEEKPTQTTPTNSGQEFVKEAIVKE